VTLNDDEKGQLREVFVTVGRAGSDLAADAEAIGRLISLVLRIPTDLPNVTLVDAIVDQLAGIGGSTSLGFGTNRVRSLADAVANVIASHPNVVRAGDVDQTNQDQSGDATVRHVRDISTNHRDSDLCPRCGQAAFAYEEACRKCHACGFSAC
jgi:ribonucleoside-diphosphate reductase alpha chain